jgi:LmbE family N-acetylglucosaminyl deacetylase
MGAVTLIFGALILGACGDDLSRCAQVSSVIPPAPPCAHEPCTDLFVAAHPDDDLLFMGSDIAGAIEASHRVVIIYVTAGELSGTGDQYWIDRERGVLNAYSALVDHRAGTHTALPDGRPDVLPGEWAAAQPTVLGSITAAEYDLRTVPITAVFLRLGDYQEQCLWEQTNGCSTHNPNPPAPPYVAVTVACPGNASSGKLACATPAPSQQVGDGALAGALEAAIERFHPTTIGMLDASGVFFDALGNAAASTGYTEYPDHFYSALYALSAALRAAVVTGELPALASYRGYTIAREPPNLTDSVACTKDLAFDAYAPFDPDVGAEHDLYALDDPASYQRRSYALRTVPPRSGVLHNQGRCLGIGASQPLMVECAVAPVWTHDASGALSSNGVCLRVVDNGGHVVRPVPQCSGSPCTPIPIEFPAEVLVTEPCGTPSEGSTFAIFDNGQIRTAYARCLSITSDQPFAADCTPVVVDGHVTGGVPDEQAWTFN